MNMRKKICMPLVAAMLLSLLSGCGKEPKAEVPMGRYVEQSGPLLEGLENVDALYRNAAGELVFYGEGTSGERRVYYRCVMPAGSETVERTEVPWLSDFIQEEGAFRMLRNISEGPDGTVYILYNELEDFSVGGPFLARSVNGGAPERLSVAELEKKDDADDPLSGFTYSMNGDGAFVVTDSAGGEVDDTAGGEDGEENDDPLAGYNYTIDENGNFIFGESGEDDDVDIDDSFGDILGDLIPGEGIDVSVGASGSFSFGGDTKILMCSGVVAMENGFLLLFGDGGIYFYNAEGVKTAEIPGQAYSDTGVYVHNGTLLLSSPDGFATYDLATMKESGSYSYKSSDVLVHVGMDDKGIYLADSTGIYRQTVGGGILERLVDASMTSLVMPNQNIVSMVSDGEDGFWAILLNAEEEYRLVHYDYDPDMPTDPSTELTIFSLLDNATVRQTIGEFQRVNPNVRVNFRVAMENNSTATAEDLIRTLNTEILNGKGPDLLLLDGLPVESYMEKGVLADLTGLLGEVEGELFSNLMRVYEQDGKVYGIPAKFTVPVMMGDAEGLDGLDSLSELLRRTGQPSEPPFLRAPGGIWADNGILMEYYYLYAGSFVKDHELDQTALKEYLDTALALDAAVKAYTPQSGGDVSYVVFTTSGAGSGFEALDQGAGDLRRGKAKVHLGIMSGVNNLAQTVGNLSEMGGQKLESTFHQNRYVPVGTMGLLAGGKQQELAKDFLRMMLSATVQDNYVYDGFPVNTASLEKLIKKAMEHNPFGGANGDDMGFFALCGELNTPILIDPVVEEAVEGQIKELIEGSLTPEQAAANVAEKVKLYLAE